MNLQQFCDKAVTAYRNIELDDLRRGATMTVRITRCKHSKQTWIMEGFPHAKRKTLQAVFAKWTWATGVKRPGAFYTHDQQTAKQTASRLNITIGLTFQEVS